MVTVKNDYLNLLYFHNYTCRRGMPHLCGKNSNFSAVGSLNRMNRSHVAGLLYCSMLMAIDDFLCNFDKWWYSSL
jgi:hypothetical protein